MSFVRLDKVTREYQLSEGNVFTALSEVSFEIKKGEFVSIVGPSGSGKSTLMHILGLLDTPTSGKYFLEGEDVTGLTPNELASIRNKKIGFVFQQFNLLQRTSALDNVGLPLIYAGMGKEKRDEMARIELTKVGLGDKLNSHPNQLSGGQQQRVAIARALVTDPEFILADEPTGNLDSKTGDEIMDVFRALNKSGRTVIVITHSKEIADMAKRTIQIKDGRIV